MNTKGLNFEYLLLDYYKKLNISEYELSTILMLNHLLEQGNDFVTADLLCLKMGLSASEIDSILVSLLKRGYIEFIVKGNKTKTSLDPLIDKLSKEYQMNKKLEEAAMVSKEVKMQSSRVIAYFATVFGRALSSLEINQVNEWLLHGYTDEIIINALKECSNFNKKSILDVQKLLLSWAAREDIEKEGNTTLSHNWNKNLEETIRIAKTPWLDEDDEK